MPYIEPNSTLRLIKGVPFDPTYENTMYFDSVSDQTDYFAGKEYLEFTHLSYTRRGRGYIRVQANIGEVYKYSYMMYCNTEFENKWFFAFVKKIEYVNNITTDIFFDIDLLQTWHFDYIFNQCFIERQHSVTDDIGDNLVPENMSVGDYICNDSQLYALHPRIIVAVTERDDPTTSGFTPVPGHVYPGIAQDEGLYYSGVTYIGFSPFLSSDVDDLNDLLEKYTLNNKIDAVITMFMGCSEVFGSNQPGEPTTLNDITNRAASSGQPGNYEYKCGNHTVRNKKLMTYPFSYFQVSNMLGEKIDLRYEFFSDPNQIRLKRFGNKTTRPAVLTYPANYRGIPLDFESAITTESFPLCSYNNDTFKAWLAQNIGSIGAGLIGSGVKLAGAFATGSPTAGLSAVGDMAALAGKAIDASTLPQTNHGNSNGDIMYQAGLCGVSTYKMSINTNLAETIDDFFDMYGYAQNKAGSPNRVARPCYTYVKTRDCSVEGALPSDDKKDIETIYNKGVRFWNFNHFKTAGGYNDTNFGNFDHDINNNEVI